MIKDLSWFVMQNNLVPVIIAATVTSLLTCYFIGPLNICYGIYIIINLIFQSIFALLGRLIFPLLTIIVSILSVIATLLLGGIALVITGVFSCPDEKSFDAWLTSFITFMIEQSPSQKQNVDQSQITIVESQSFTDKFWKMIMDLINKYVFPSVGTIVIKKTMFSAPRFWYCGFFRLAYCVTPDNKQLTFIGALNTWIPWNEKNLNGPTNAS